MPRLSLLSGAGSRVAASCLRGGLVPVLVQGRCCIVRGLFGLLIAVSSFSLAESNAH